jgi:hypothetical protein
LGESGPVFGGLGRGLVEGSFLGVWIDQLYHRGVSGLFCCVDECFCNRLPPVDACAEDVEEEGFELVCFGHSVWCFATVGSEANEQYV